MRGIVDYQVGTTQRRTDGAFADLLPEDDRFRQSAFDASLGVALGTRANLRSSLRKSDANGRTVGPITYGSRDSGAVYETDDLSWHANVSHAIGGRFTGAGTVNYFRYGNFTTDTIADPPYATYAILEGTPNALFPRGSRLVRLVDEAEFTRLSAAGALPASGQFLASRVTTDFVSAQPSITQFRRPAVRYQGDYVWGGNQRLSAEYGGNVNAGSAPPPIPKSNSTTIRCSCNNSSTCAIAGSWPWAAASIARRRATRSSARSYRRAGSWCRFARRPFHR